MIKKPFRPSRIKNGKRVRAKLYRGRFRFDGETKIHDVPLHTTDKQIAEQRLNKIVLEAEREREGLIAPKIERDAANREILQHVEDFITSRVSVGRDRQYVKQLGNQLHRLCGECGWKLLRDVTADSFERWRATQHVSPKTLNEYQNAVSSFMNWMVVRQRIVVNPLRFVSKAATHGEKKRKRRAFTFDELQRLVSVAGARRVSYTLAAFTGLRRSELKLLEWRDIELQSERPCIHVRGSTTKNRKDAVLDLHPDAVRLLLPIASNAVDPGAYVLKGLLPKMPRFRKDLAAAGIEYLNAKGEFADFHALRKTFGTLLTVNRASPRETMELMRHSDMKLTTKIYTDAGQLSTGDAVLRLPSVLSADSQIDSQTTVSSGLLLSSPVHGMQFGHLSGMPINKGFEGNLAAPVPVSPEAEKSGRQDSNLRPRGPKPRALPS
jgi:integrase